MDIRFNPERSVHWIGDVNDRNLARVTKTMTTLFANDAASPIFLLLKTDGGDMAAGFTFYDFVRRFKPPLVSVAIGEVASMGVVLFVSAEHRAALMRATFYLHEPHTTVEEASVAEMNEEMKE